LMLVFKHPVEAHFPERDFQHPSGGRGGIDTEE